MHETTGTFSCSDILKITKSGNGDKGQGVLVGLGPLLDVTVEREGLLRLYTHAERPKALGRWVTRSGLLGTPGLVRFFGTKVTSSAADQQSEPLALPIRHTFLFRHFWRAFGFPSLSAL
jgi:hypothetical protein